MYKRLYTIIKETKHHPKTRQFLGFPPELTEGKDYRIPLPWPKILIIEETHEGFFLYRYDVNKNFAGDTWHMTLEDAKYQANSEYKNLLGEWKEIPKDVKDAIDFAIKQVSR